MTSLVDRFIHRYGRLPTEVDPDYLEMLRMSKYRIMDVPDVQPGKCGNCGASKQDGRKYVDIGLHLDFYGALILCTLCLDDIARNAGLFDSYLSDIRGLRNNRDYLEKLQIQGSNLQRTILNTFGEVTRHFDNLHSLGDDVSVDTSAVLDGNSSTEEPVNNPSGTSQTESGVKSTKSRVTKSTSSSRSSEFSSLAELLKSVPD